MEPYYEDDYVTLYHGDCLPLVMDDGFLDGVDVLVTDPPFGISYHSNKQRDEDLAASISGDDDTLLRDLVLARWGERPALVFGSWKADRPGRTRMVLVWNAGPAVGMGDLAMPWKPCWQEIYVIGSGFSGPRTSAVLSFPPVQTTGRAHPNQKPTDLLTELIGKCPDGVVLDPFAGAGSTLIAAKALGRRAVGIEIEERYCEVAADRLSQENLELGGVA